MNMGFDGFIWFFGKVENIDDPEQIGRVQVRIFNLHSDNKADIDTADLQWASLGQDPTSASHEGIGRSPTGTMIGSLVFGFFLDGKTCQQPAITQVFAGKPGGVSDVSKLATGTNIITKGDAKHEPASPYKAEYPHNKTLTTESGHAVEIDDTPGHERIHVYHKSGTYIEVGPTGDTVIKSVGDSFELNLKNKILYVKGDYTVDVTGATSITSETSIHIKAPSITIEEV